MKKNNSKGFTLIELLVVIAIIGVLSGVVLQSLKDARYKSHNATRLSDIDQINKALELYMTKTPGAGFPTTNGSWQCVGQTAICWTSFEEATSLNNALTGNISKIPKDPVIATGAGDYYLYNSSFNEAGAYGGEGAYIQWMSNNFGASSCGRGETFVEPVPGSVYRTCILYLGK